MFVPVVPHTRVINKTVVYSDTVLPLKDIGNNIKVTCIGNVKEYSLEHCLRTVFEANPKVIFNTIQYSKNDNKVYFYTNTEIITKTYEESRWEKYTPLTSNVQILEEIKRILTEEKNKDVDSISIHDVSNLMTKMKQKENNIEEKYKQRCDTIVKMEICRWSSILINGFDYENKELSISLVILMVDMIKLFLINRMKIYMLLNQNLLIRTKFFLICVFLYQNFMTNS